MFKLTGNHLFLSLGGTVFTIVLLTQMHILALSSLLIVTSGHTLCISNNFFARICIRMAYKGWCVRGRRLNTRKSPNQRVV